MGSKLKSDFAYIAQLLKSVEYSGACAEEGWLRTLLLDPGDQRDQLLEWLLQRLLPTDAFTARHQTTRPLQRLCSLGLCGAGDGDVVEGRAGAGQQLRLWRLLLEAVRNKRDMNSAGHATRVQHRTDALLHALCESRAVQLTNKIDSSSNSSCVLPGELQERYRSWSRQPRQQQVAPNVLELQQELYCTKQQYQQLPQEFKSVPTASEASAAVERLQTCLNRTTADGQLFAQVSTQHFTPWLATQQHQHQLPDTGRVVREAYEPLKQLTQILSSTAALASKTEELQAAETIMLTTLDEPTVLTATVHRLATTNKS